MSGRSSAKRAIILDAAAIILGFTQVEDGIAVTPSSVLEEMRHREARYRALAAQEGRSIRVMEPDRRCVEEVRALARELGEADLSEADVSVLALALQLSREGWDTLMITSDYSVQNMASRLGLKFKPILHRGIREVVSWEVYCEACRWIGEGRVGDPCPRCGHRLKRKPRRRLG